MGWKHFSNYSLRAFDLTHHECKVHIVFRNRKWNYRQKEIQVDWFAYKRKGKKYAFSVYYGPIQGPNWRKIFHRLRRSLAYGLNPGSREVTKRLLESKGKSVHDIHREWSVSSVLGPQ